MKVHVLQHVAFEGIGSIEDCLRDQNAEITCTRFDQSDPLPGMAGIDLVIVMGGPMSVNDEALHPWLIAEKRFLREAIGQGVTVLGICLGAQLIASALGACVYPAPQREIGWFDIQGTRGTEDVFRFPEKLPVFHWHGETFDLPEGAVRLAGSAACQNQAFQAGANVIGLQFHLEATPAGVDAMIAHCGGELVEGPYIQSEEAIRGVPAECYVHANRLMVEVLSWLTRPVA
jgi:GMP synthase-like glutamine amidotransferase